MQASLQSPQRPHSRRAGIYTDVSVQGAAASENSSHALIGMLYDGLLGAIARARGALRDGDVEGRARAIGQAVAIVGEGLRASLNLAEGGALATNLDSLYGYLELRLTQANLRSDDSVLDECARLVRPLQDAWRQIAPQVQHAA